MARPRLESVPEVPRGAQQDEAVIGALCILWHEIRCPAARHGAAIVIHTDAGRIYDCGFAIVEAY